MRVVWCAGMGSLLVSFVTAIASAQTSMTWPEVRDRFRATNPSLQAGEIGVDESKAVEITAFLRPNPQCAITYDQIGNTVTSDQHPGNIFSASTLGGNCNYLWERDHKRGFRLDSAQGATAIARSAQADLERGLLFTLRTAFVQVLQAKAFLALAQQNLTTYDQVLGVSRDRLRSGDIAQIDLDRLELQRVTYESDVQTAEVNLRTAKIQLLRLMNDQTTMVDQVDVSGPYDFSAPAQSLNEFRRIAFDVRPDLRASLQAIDKARTDHRLAMANGSTDLTIGVDAGFPSISQVWESYSPPLRQFVGVSLGMPLRIFDSNQGEKLRTQLDITRSERLADSARLQVFGDVDTAYATVISTVALLQPYRDRYLAQATRVRDTVTFSYQRGGASLVDFLQAQQEYRSVQISYVNLVAAYLTALAQLNQAIGKEVLP